ncbi:hypothetical protein PILCRDRAFT_225715 [Piloderma croceum F 1598]|uniref:Uncharacterized protein n=1 Tax=Piloderma croceum (strain F 1598) TaxID=765440 RepID=A0A0C3CI27_PILCF|nr:hypothetical protein PILCRDRAFT_225715 [Piloderma croceum F 1598]
MITNSPINNNLHPANRSTLAPKQFGSEDILAALVAETALVVIPTGEKGFNVDNVRVVKIMGGSLSESKVVRGMVFGRESEAYRHNQTRNRSQK